jgi:hypothetical protein
MYTPPYHPELQPIELIWARIKNAIARDPARTAAELNAKVAEGFTHITSNDWVGVYRHIQKEENRYLVGLDECELADDECSCVSESDSE